MFLFGTGQTTPIGLHNMVLYSNICVSWLFPADSLGVEVCKYDGFVQQRYASKIPCLIVSYYIFVCVTWQVVVILYHILYTLF